jgi:hypothetical protein
MSDQNQQKPTPSQKPGQQQQAGIEKSDQQKSGQQQGQEGHAGSGPNQTRHG